MITEENYLEAKRIVDSYESKQLNKHNVSGRCFSKFDMKGAWEAGQELTNHDWHMKEFHGFSCKCKAPEYNDFNEWFEKHCH